MGKPRKKKLLTRIELAAEEGVWPGTITRWEQDGCPVAKKQSRGKPTLFDLDAVRSWRQAIEDVKKTEEISLEHERALLARCQREKVEMENAKRRGELVEADQVVFEVQNLIRALQAQIRALPGRFVQQGLIAREHESVGAQICQDLMTRISGWKTSADTDRAASEATDAA